MIDTGTRSHYLDSINHMNMKNIILLTIAIAAFSTANAQMISRSSISSIGSHSIGRMNLSVAAIEEVIVEEVIATEVAEVTETPAIEFGTLTAYPNPAVDNINFTFELTEAGNVSVSVYNTIGQKVSDVFASSYDGGSNTQQIDLSSYTAGIYFISLTHTSANGKSNTITKKIQVIK